MPLFLDGDVTFSGFYCLVPLSPEETGCTGGGTSGQVGTLGTETGKTRGTLSVWSSKLALPRCFSFLGSLQLGWEVQTADPAAARSPAWP